MNQFQPPTILAIPTGDWHRFPLPARPSRPIQLVPVSTGIRDCPAFELTSLSPGPPIDQEMLAGANCVLSTPMLDAEQRQTQPKGDDGTRRQPFAAALQLPRHARAPTGGDAMDVLRPIVNPSAAASTQPTDPLGRCPPTADTAHADRSAFRPRTRPTATAVGPQDSVKVNVGPVDNGGTERYAI